MTFKEERDEAAKKFQKDQLEVSYNGITDTYKSGANFTLTSSLVKQMAYALERTKDFSEWNEFNGSPTYKHIINALTAYEAALKELK